MTTPLQKLLCWLGWHDWVQTNWPREPYAPIFYCTKCKRFK